MLTLKRCLSFHPPLAVLPPSDTILALFLPRIAVVPADGRTVLLPRQHSPQHLPKFPSVLEQFRPKGDGGPVLVLPGGHSGSLGQTGVVVAPIPPLQVRQGLQALEGKKRLCFCSRVGSVGHQQGWLRPTVNKMAWTFTLTCSLSKTIPRISSFREFIFPKY